METFMKVWVIVQSAAIAVTVRLLIKLHKPKQEPLKNNKNEKEKKL
ncbi:MAG: hypothetical protein NC253_00910 [Ruminococcus sp.]|nr:hypothetical protein [Ruminococcus sp.]MCM1382638.1 hypothetical protein [Muribaculaceae bacterium]MCM1478979.1 hypothetical protein [Muribaculaceae bacterium]